MKNYSYEDFEMLYHMMETDLKLDDYEDDVLSTVLEAETFGSTHIMVKELYPIVEKTLSTPVGDRRFKQAVGNYMDRNSEKLHTPGPVYMIPFADQDKATFYGIFNVTGKQITDMVIKVIAQLDSSSDFKLLKGNPQFWLFYMCIRFYHLKKDEKGLNTALAIYALSVYPSVFHLFFKYGANEAVMQYTMDNLTDKYLMKQAGHVFGALFISIQHSYAFLKPFMEDASDKEIIRFIQRIRNDQKSMIKKICDKYMQNHRQGLRVNSTKDSNMDAPIDDEAQNKTSIVEFVGRKVTLPIITNGVDLKRASLSAKLAQVSIADSKFYLSKIVTDAQNDRIAKFIQSVLFLYLYDENKTKEDINSSHFLKWSGELFRRTNSGNDNIKCIKDTLDYWAEDTGVHAKFKREASRVNYKRMIFFYFILSIQYYNN